MLLLVVWKMQILLCRLHNSQQNFVWSMNFLTLWEDLQVNQPQLL